MSLNNNNSINLSIDLLRLNLKSNLNNNNITYIITFSNIYYKKLFTCLQFLVIQVLFIKFIYNNRLSQL